MHLLVVASQWKSLPSVQVNTPADFMGIVAIIFLARRGFVTVFFPGNTTTLMCATGRVSVASSVMDTVLTFSGHIL